jgi:hypothetical protein
MEGLKEGEMRARRSRDQKRRKRRKRKGRKVKAASTARIEGRTAGVTLGGLLDVEDTYRTVVEIEKGGNSQAQDPWHELSPGTLLAKETGWTSFG